MRGYLTLISPSRTRGIIQFLLLSAQFWAVSALAANGAPEPKSARALYNQGTLELRQGKLREAETLLQSAVASNQEEIQRAALFNLGHARFRQGLDLLKQGPNPAAAQNRTQEASANADQAIDQVQKALQDNQLASLLAAYQNGRGVRKELKAALEAIQSALDLHGAVLLRWERASSDFKSAHELASDPQAKANADAVDRRLAQLVDQLHLMQQMAMAGKQKRDLLSKLLSQLKGRLPKGMVPGDDDDDDEQKQPKEPQQGKEEQQLQRGWERMMTWEEAIRLLESLKLDANHVIPMVTDRTGQPRKRAGKEW